jgi:hypothetical protein
MVKKQPPPTSRRAQQRPGRASPGKGRMTKASHKPGDNFETPPRSGLVGRFLLRVRNIIVAILA